MSELMELAGRCEKATAPDRRLDAAIFYEVRVTKSDSWTRASWVAAALREDWNITPYTASIDAAMRLIPERWHAILYTENCTAELYNAGLKKRAGIKERSQAKTLILAIAAASLRARATIDGGRG